MIQWVISLNLFCDFTTLCNVPRLTALRALQANPRQSHSRQRGAVVDSSGA